MAHNFLADLHAHCASLRNISEDLRWLADAFAATGNTVAGDRLSILAADLYASQAAISGSYGHELSNQLEVSQAAFRETVAAAFRGLTKVAKTKAEAA